MEIPTINTWDSNRFFTEYRIEFAGRSFHAIYTKDKTLYFGSNDDKQTDRDHSIGLQERGDIKTAPEDDIARTIFLIFCDLANIAC